tara:strand:- start:504 stop:641 length:138 start_codon:yes stop_codon:yes gene_type:complete
VIARGGGGMFNHAVPSKLGEGLADVRFLRFLKNKGVFFYYSNSLI